MRPMLAALCVAIIATLSAQHAHAAACAGFVDVSDADTEYCAAVTYLRNTGITLGCDATHYCPADSVTRLQMALFMKRMADKAVFRQGGNAFGAPAVLGTTDTQPLSILVDGTPLLRGFRIAHTAGYPTSSVGGDASNSLGADAYGAVIGGGGAGAAFGNCGLLADEACNHHVERPWGTIGGGLHNAVIEQYGTVGGGNENIAGNYGVVAGGSGNHAPGGGQTIAGGVLNNAGDTALYATVGGGAFNGVYAERATVAGGYGNYASFKSATIGGGESNGGAAEYVAVAGGLGNTASGSYAFVGGGHNNVATGEGAVVPGGSDNAAGGAYSVVLGRNATTTSAAAGSFVFSDSTTSALAFGTNNANQFLVAAAGGIRMMTNKDFSTGCSIAPGGGTWSCSSSRSVKRDFDDVDAGAVLDKVAALPIMRWRYATEDPAVRHMGTFAEDFRAAFGLGQDDRSIALADADGVALAAIQALHARGRAADAALADARAQARALEESAARKDAHIADLEARLQRVEARLSMQGN